MVPDIRRVGGVKRVCVILSLTTCRCFFTDPELEENEGESSQGEEEDESTLAGSTTSSPSAAPAPLPLPLTAEERAGQLQQTLSALAEERAELANTVKVTRRDAQKADAALRAEIEVLKRASEKQAAAEARARQKMLALQEAAKQATAASADATEAMRELERSLPALQARREAREAEHARVKVDADAARAEREAEAANGHKREEAARAELAGLGNRLDKLCTKREKLEAGTIVDLEEQLRALQEEIERVERDPYGYVSAAAGLHSEDGPEPDEFVEPDGGTIHLHSRGLSGPVSPRGRQHYSSQHHPAQTVVGRPGPIQRPQHPAHNAHHISHHPHHHHHTLSGALREQHALPTPAPGAIGSGGPRKPVHASSFPPLSAAVSTGKQPAAPSATPAAGVLSASQSASTLSSRAPPFQPRRGSRASELNPASTPFEPKSILVNPNRQKTTPK